MNRFSSTDEFDESDRDLAATIWSAFSKGWGDKINGPAVSFKVIEGETDHLGGVSPIELFERREELILTSDPWFLAIVDLAILLPAYLVASIRPGDTDLPSVMVDYLNPTHSLFRSQLKGRLTDIERQAVCSYLRHRHSRLLEGWASLDPVRLQEEVEYGTVEEEETRFLAAINYWCG